MSAGEFFKIGAAIGGGGAEGASLANVMNDALAGAKFGGVIGAGIQAEKDRQQLADEKISAEIDANWGTLYGGETGDESYDASLQEMSRGWKQEFNAVMTDPNLSAAERAIAKNQILDRAKQVKAGSDALAGFANDFFEAEANGQISASTPANIKLLADALRNKEGVNIMNDPETGQPVLIGQLADGSEVRTPIAEIASGKNQFRFNTKFDTTSALDTIAKDLEGKNLAPEQVAARAGHEVEKILENESTIRAIAADELNINPAEYDADPESARAMVKAELEERLQQEYLPKQLTALQQEEIQLKRDAGGRAQQQLNIAQEGLQLKKEQIELTRDANFINQQNRKAAGQQTYDIVNQVYANPANVTPESISTAFGVPAAAKGNNLTLKINGKDVIVTDYKTPAGRTQLMKIFGGRKAQGDIGIEYNEDGSPVRRSALKRFTTWLDSMVKN